MSGRSKPCISAIMVLALAVPLFAWVSLPIPQNRWAAQPLWFHSFRSGQGGQAGPARSANESGEWRLLATHPASPAGTRPERSEWVLFNDVSRREIMDVEPVWDLGFYGQGQVVAVADTGLDTGDLSTLSADFSGRVRQTFAWGRPDDWSDPHGHGTHVAGSAVGAGSLSGSDPATHRYSRSFAGLAPEAELVFQSLLDAEGGLGGLPLDLGELLGQAYDAGARVHTNSWGGNFFIKPMARFLTAGRYTPEAAQVDSFLWEHPDMVVLFAAGNEGVDILTPQEGGLEFPPPDGVVDLHSVGSPGTAKNVITVGATEGLRDEGGHAAENWGGEGDLLSGMMGDSYPVEPLASDLPSDNADGMAPFSGRGPTNDGRIKPDVVAPGTNIISARSHASGAGELFGAYDEDYSYCSGTSMSTPLVAGAVTLIREWYVKQQGMADPSAALVKATLINGTVDISPGQFDAGPTQDVPDAWPNSVTGWGRVSVKEAIVPGGEREVWFVDDIEGLNTSQEASFTRYAAAGTDQPFRVALVWTDPPGALEPESIQLPGLTEQPAPELVNDLDLIVETPDGVSFYGNMGAEPDRLNNVEAVRVTDPPAGDYRIIVRAHQVQQGPQPFALVVTGQRVVSGPKEKGVIDVGTGTDETPSGEENGWVIPVLAGMGVVAVGLAGAVFAVYRAQARRPLGTIYASSPPSPQWSSGAIPSAASGQGGASPQGAAGMAGPQGANRGGMASTAHLRAQSGPLAGQSFAVNASPFIIGRGADCNLVVPESPISRRHASLELFEGRWFLRDLESSNGTFLNRQQLMSPQPLHDGDLVGLGESVFAFAGAAPSAGPAQRPGGRPGPRGAGQKSRSKWVIGIVAGVVLVALVVAVVLLVSGLGDKEEAGGTTPGLPGLPGLPSVGIPTITLPTGLPSVGVEIPTGMPEIPTSFPTGLPVPTGGMEFPTGLPIPFPKP